MAERSSKLQQEFEKRMGVVGMLITFLAIVLAGRLAYMQLVKGAYYEQRAEQNGSRRLVIDAPRGDIATSDGALLATSRPAYVVSWLVPGSEADREAEIPLLAQLLSKYKVTPESIQKQIEENTWRRYQPIRLAVDIDEETVQAIDERRMELPGVTVERQAVRAYPNGNMACYLVGGLGAITQNTVADYRNAGYRLDATVGIFGLEKTYELVDPKLSLRGVDGHRQVEVDYANRLVADLGETPAVAGNNLILTIDSRLQAAAEQTLNDVITKLNDNNSRYPQKPSKGAAVVLNVKTGAILTWASYPGFDEADWASSDYLWTSNIPLNAYPVGSTFKPMTLMAGVLAGVVKPDDKFMDPGYYQVGATKKWDYNRSGYGQVTLTQAIKLSINVVFYNIAQRLINVYGTAGAMDAIAAVTRLFGFDQELPIDFAPGYLSSPGMVPSSENFKRIYGYTPYPGEVWDIAIGQGIVEFTPLQMASYMSMLANGGYRYQPYVVQEIQSPAGEVNWEAEPKLLNKIDLDPTAMAIIREGMHEVTLPANGAPGNGSAYYLFTTDPVMRDGKKVEVAGKTGTAEVGKLTPHSWFISFAPFEDPEIAIAVFVEHGRTGASGAVPVTHAIYKAYFESTSTVTP
jgi:penicillin-binding protein 2